LLSLLSPSLLLLPLVTLLLLLLRTKPPLLLLVLCGFLFSGFRFPLLGRCTVRGRVQV
jgi:hypothetical protein